MNPSIMSAQFCPPIQPICPTYLSIVGHRHSLHVSDLVVHAYLFVSYMHPCGQTTSYFNSSNQLHLTYNVPTWTQPGLTSSRIKVRFGVSTICRGSWVSVFEMSDPFGPATTRDFSFKSNFVKLSWFYCVC